MNTNDFIPAVAPQHIILEDNNARWMDGYTTLENGIVLKLVGDGTAHDEQGTQWTQISREIEEDEYEVVGWAETSDLTTGW